MFLPPFLLQPCSIGGQIIRGSLTALLANYYPAQTGKLVNQLIFSEHIRRFTG